MVDQSRLWGCLKVTESPAKVSLGMKGNLLEGSPNSRKAGIMVSLRKKWKQKNQMPLENSIFLSTLFYCKPVPCMEWRTSYPSQIYPKRDRIFFFPALAEKNPREVLSLAL